MALRSSGQRSKRTLLLQLIGLCVAFTWALPLSGCGQPTTLHTVGKPECPELSVRESRGVLQGKPLDAVASSTVVFAGKPGPAFFNYQPYLTVSKDTWICCWTQGTIEASADQRVVAARSLDKGLTWSAPIPIEEAAPGYKVPAWVTCFSVPSTGRVYAFYWYNVNGEPLRDAGDIFYRHSDDKGQTWSRRYPVRLPRSDIDDATGEIHGWNFGQPRILSTGQVILTFTKIRRSSLFPKDWTLSTEGRWARKSAGSSENPPTPDGGNPNEWETEVFLLECANILGERDPAALEFRVLPGGPHGLSVPYPGSNRSFGQEGSVVTLSNGRLMCIFRTRRGSPYFAFSSDRGRSWTKPEVLCQSPGGQPFQQPCAPCPLQQTSDGRFILLFHNAMPDTGGWHPRNPLWIAIGRESSDGGREAELVFTAPKVLLYNDNLPGGPYKDAEISYPQYYEMAGQRLVVFAHKTSEIRVSRIPCDWTEGPPTPH